MNSSFLSLGLALLLAPGLPACSRHVFEAMPSTPAEVLAFKLRTLKPGQRIQVASTADQWTEGHVVTASPDSVVIASERGPVTIPASSLRTINRHRPSAGTTVGRAAGGAALLGALLTGLIYVAGSLTDSAEDDYSAAAVGAYLVGRGALAGAVFGGLIAATTPRWVQVYPVPAGARP